VQRPLAVIVGAGVIGLITAAVVASRKVATLPVVVSDDVSAVDPASHDSNIRAIARDLFSDHVLAFELTSVLLVIGVVGTVLLARRPDRQQLDGDAR
jgi:NADH-quinone oxidoreductase subunit J